MQKKQNLKHGYHLVGYADFCRLVHKGAVVTLVISGVTGPILIKLAHDVYNIAIKYF